MILKCSLKYEFSSSMISITITSAAYLTDINMTFAYAGLMVVVYGVSCHHKLFFYTKWRV